MPSKQIIAYGGTFERSLNGTTWTTIPEVKALGIPQITQEYQEATSLDSPDNFREYIKGMRDAGEITVQAGYTPAGYEQQLADQAAADPVYYRATMAKSPGQTAGDRFTFRGFPVPRATPGALGDIVNMDITIRITGSVAWTKGAGA